MKITKRTHYWRTFARHCLKRVDIDKEVYSMFDKDFDNINQKYIEIINKPNENSVNKTIWIFWYQGIENAPNIIRYCIDSVRKNANGAQVIILDKTNFLQYVKIPDFVLKKIEDKKITITHFSDILRVALLAEYGGVWIDATVFLVKPLEDECYTLPFYTLHTGLLSGLKFVKGRWTAYFQAARKKSLLHSYLRDLLYQYWEKYDYLFDYFFIDYVLNYACQKFPQFNLSINSVPINNVGTFTLMSHFNYAYNEKRWNTILSSAYIFKLTYKYNFFKCKKRTIFGKKTIYSKFLETFTSK